MKLNRLLFAGLIALLLDSGPLPAKPRPASQTDQIAFVHLRFTGETVQLVSCKIVSGHLKPTSKPAGKRIGLRVVGADGSTQWETWIKDPHTRVLEVADSSGRLSAKVITVERPEITVRVPYFEMGQTLSVWRIPQEGEAAATLLATLQLPKP